MALAVAGGWAQLSFIPIALAFQVSDGDSQASVEAWWAPEMVLPLHRSVAYIQLSQHPGSFDVRVWKRVKAVKPEHLKAKGILLMRCSCHFAPFA